MFCQDEVAERVAGSGYGGLHSCRWRLPVELQQSVRFQPPTWHHAVLAGAATTWRDAHRIKKPAVHPLKSDSASVRRFVIYLFWTPFYFDCYAFYYFLYFAQHFPVSSFIFIAYLYLFFINNLLTYNMRVSVEFVGFYKYNWFKWIKKKLTFVKRVFKVYNLSIT